MIRGDLRHVMLDFEEQKGGNGLNGYGVSLLSTHTLQNDRQMYQAYNEEIRRKEIDKLKQEYNELKMRGFKRKAANINAGVETLKKEGPSMNQNKRV